MRTVYVQELMRLPLGKQGENGAARIVWQGLAARYQALYGSGAFTLTAKRGGGNEWVKVAETTLTEIVNEIRLNFDPCKAVYLEFQYGAVEDNLGVIGIPLRTAGRRA